MEYNPIHLEKFLKGYHTLSPIATELQDFRAALTTFFQVSENESEEHQKNALNSFITKSFGYQCNTKERIDLAIYQEGQARVFFECKRLSEKSDFVKNKNNLDSKAFYESILYYLREFFTYENNNLTFIILTNTRDFYLIDAKEYLVFTKNKAIKKAFENCEKKQGNDTSTKKFYDEAKAILQKLDHTFTYTHFTLTPDLSECALSHIYQVLSPKVLLKAISYIDANTLNQAFYDELLYILGLHEIAEGTKVLIRPSSTPNTLLDSLCKAYGFSPVSDFESIFALLTTWNNRILFLRLLESMLLSFKHIDTPFLQIERIGDFPTLNTLFFDVLAKKEKERSNIPRFLESIPYLNSSLFDRNALELDEKEIKLLDSRPLELYPHSILHKDEAFKRDYKDQKSLPLLEYLFAFLRAYDFTTIPSDIKDNIKINQNKLINSAVLGLVFEKLNGYQEGSFYTPSFITNYMCKQSLEKVVIDKFNQAQSWDCKDLESLKFKIDKLTDSQDGYKQANAIFDSIKICDPSVGSGHFLVSVLNWLIYLKFKLKILCDENYERLKDITLEIQNDEILIRDSQNKIFSYALPAHDQIESHKLQRALFQAKRKLIESCLFGVDINPNSCEITKLRLWIELLKFSYYKDIEQKYLETLPNIDINIKCGNSLVSNIALDMTKESLEKDLKLAINKGAQLEMHEDFTTMSNALNKLPERIENYKNAVNAYKNETNSDLKKLHQRQIAESKDFIVKIFHTMSAEYRVFKSLLSNYLKEYGYSGIDDAHINDKPLESSLKQSLNDYIIDFNFHKSLDIPRDARGYSTKELLALIDSMYGYENLLSDRSAFEWRFEFPEVLNSNGDFMGFDLIIGNPPYIDYRKIESRIKTHLMKTSQVYKVNKEGSIFVYFIERAKELMTLNGNCIFINPIAYICTESGRGIRNFIDKNFTLLQMVDVSDFKVFASASTYTCINYFQHKADIGSIKFGRVGNENELDSVKLREIPNVKIENLSVQLDPVAVKIENAWSMRLSDCCDIFCGLSVAGFRKDVVSDVKSTNAPFLESSDILRYGFKGGKYLKKINSYYSQEKIDIFQDSEIVFMARMTNFIRCCVVPKGYYGGKVNILHNFKIDKNFVMGILNSKLLSYFYAKKYFASHMQGGAFGFDTISVGNLPIPKPDSKNKKLTDKVIALVDQILETKAKDPEADIAKLESEIDSLVYGLYGLEDSEIKVIENKK